MESIPIDVVIPHYQGRERLLRCLEALFKTEYPSFQVLLVDNGSEDGSCDEALRLFPQLQVLRLEENRGFAGGCNAGVLQCQNEFVALLNDDTEVNPDWLSQLISRISTDAQIAVVQPKLRRLTEKDKFEYAGGAGGMIDIYGYPFCYGRVFETIEVDSGQYDRIRRIFWASGSACLFRRSLYLRANGLDEKFFAHQEEIDLNWRLQLMGYWIEAVPSAVVYHYGGGTLPPTNLKKKYFNHRNSIMMLIKNYELKTLIRVIPVRLLLEAAAVILAIKQRDFRRILAILGALCWNLFKLPLLIKERKTIHSLRQVPDEEILRRMYPKTVALQYYLFDRKSILELLPDKAKLPQLELNSQI
jgi:GT2 family glycosyltransferase